MKEKETFYNEKKIKSFQNRICPRHTRFHFHVEYVNRTHVSSYFNSPRAKKKKKKTNQYLFRNSEHASRATLHRLITKTRACPSFPRVTCSAPRILNYEKIFIAEHFENFPLFPSIPDTRVLLLSSEYQAESIPSCFVIITTSSSASFNSRRECKGIRDIVVECSPIFYIFKMYRVEPLEKRFSWKIREIFP